MSDPSGLPELIRQITRPGLFWGLARIGDEGALFPEEAAHVARALPARRAEFLAGRIAARRALMRMGCETLRIPAAPDRAPVWPTGITGSISHTGHIAVAVVAEATRHPLLGIDVESAAPLPADAIDEICRPDELGPFAGTDRALRARRIFSAKEALYKAQYPRSRTIFGFHALRIDLCTGTAQFPDHPETAMIPPDFRAPLRFVQAIGPQLILSLGHAPD